MKCPQCPDVTLTMTERAGVEIDYCPSCRGVWLDRGELDKIVDRAADQAGAVAARGSAPTLPLPPPQQQHQHYSQHHASKPDDSHYGYPAQQGGHPQSGYRKKKSWLSEIFD